MESVDKPVPTLAEAVAAMEPQTRAVLERAVAVARRTVPSATDGVSYGMPALLYRGKAFFAVNAGRKFLSLYPFSGKVISALREELAGFETTSGSIHFSVAQPLPEALVRKVVEARLREIERQP